MSLLVFYVVHHLVPSESRFTKQELSLRFGSGVTEAAAKEYIFKHHGEVKVNSEGEIVSPDFAKIITVQKASSAEGEISVQKVWETLKK